MANKAETLNKTATVKKSKTVKEPAAPKASTATGDDVTQAKPKTQAKPRKVAVPQKTLGTVTPIDINREPAPPTISLMGISAEAVARLAHQFWLERGCQHGHDAEDWFRAEQALRSKAS
jgi:hypothetical protein